MTLKQRQFSGFRGIRISRNVAEAMELILKDSGAAHRWRSLLSYNTEQRENLRKYYLQKELNKNQGEK